MDDLSRFFFFLVKNKKGSWLKKRTKEEDVEKGRERRLRAARWQSLINFVGLDSSGTDSRVTSQTRVNRVSAIYICM